MYKCDYCDFKSKKKWHTIRHQELNCSVHKNKLIPVLTDEEVLKLFSDCNITKFDFNKICFLKADISFLCVMIDLPLWSVSGVTSQYLVGLAALSVPRCECVIFYCGCHQFEQLISMLGLVWEELIYYTISPKILEKILVQKRDFSFPFS